MTQIHWINAVSASFTVASDWSGGVVPGAGDDAILNAPGTTAYTVTSSTNETVSSIQTAANATLAVTGGVFTATGGTGAGANAGLIAVESGANFSAGGTMDNTGAITASPGAQNVQISIGPGGLTLEGGGAVSLDSNQGWIPVISGGVLTNVNNALTGSFEYTAPELINEAAGVIDATSNVYIGIDAVPVTVINAGLIETTQGGVMSIGSDSGADLLDDSSGGVVLAEDGSAIVLDATVIGGTLKTTGTGYFAPEGVKGVWDGTKDAVNLEGLAHLQSSMRLTLQGAINNTGAIQFRNISIDLAPPTIIVGAAGATLTGGGLITMAGNPSNLITGATAGAVFTNVDNTIRGAGLIGDGSMKLINLAQGAIIGSTVNTMIIDTGASIIRNAGLIEATGAGGVTIESAIFNTGTLEAAGGTLTVNGAVSGAGANDQINGGTLYFTSAFNQKVAFTGASGVLNLARSQTYHASISGFSTTGGTSLDLADIGFVSATEATYSGTTKSGVLTVTDGTHTARIHLTGNYTASTFTASSDGHGGTVVIDPAAPSQAPAHRFIAAAASLGARPGGPASMTHEAGRGSPAMLARPSAMVA